MCQREVSGQSQNLMFFNRPTKCTTKTQWCHQVFVYLCIYTCLYDLGIIFNWTSVDNSVVTAFF